VLRISWQHIYYDNAVNVTGEYHSQVMMEEGGFRK